VTVRLSSSSSPPTRRFPSRRTARTSGGDAAAPTQCSACEAV
jgi:hypothetical protein